MEQQVSMTPMYLEFFKSNYTYLSNQNICIIGGAQLLETCVDIIDEIWLSRIKSTYNCDTVLPKDLITSKFDFYERYFDGTLTIEKYRKNNNETIS